MGTVRAKGREGDMWRTRGSVLVTLALVELVLVGAGLTVAVSTYTHYVTALCGGLSALGPLENLLWFLALALLALPLAVGLPVHVVVSAVRERRWGWVVVAVLSVAASVGLVLAGYQEALGWRQFVVAALGNACGRYDVYILYFVAYGLVTLTCLAYALGVGARPRPAA
jgi:hypothetical protein